MFEPGRLYRNRRGQYEVLRIDGDKMRIRYDSGEKVEVDVELEQRIVANIRREDANKCPSDDDVINRDFFGTVGYFAYHALLIEGFGTPRATRGFREVYRQLSGRDLLREKHYYTHDEETAKWGVELRIEYPMPASGRRLEFASYLVKDVRSLRQKDVRRINNNGYIRCLFSIGFMFGADQDLDRIRSHLPNHFINAFNDGRTW